MKTKKTKKQDQKKLTLGTKDTLLAMLEDELYLIRGGYDEETHPTLHIKTR